MPQKTNLNVNPYYEDFDPNKNYYKILFRPGYSIQGRELTQLQSILQNQVESFGKFAFKQGELVIPGEVSLNTRLDYVKLSSVSEVAINDGTGIVYKKYDISQLVGTQLRGLSSGVFATVLTTANATDSSSDTLYVNYLNSGDSNTEEKFRQGETVEVVDGVNTPLMVVGTDGSVLPTSIRVEDPDTGDISNLDSPATGYASAVQVKEGIYFVNGFFVRNDDQLLVIDSYYDRPSAKVGFTIKEDIITPEQDSSLYDNSIGSSNFTAPGAHRLKISLSLTKFGLKDITDKNFIQLITVSKGAIQKKITPTDYNLLEQTLARRTFDESGDYVVDNFSVDVREYAQRDGNRGVYAADDNENYNGLTAAEASRKMIASIGPGKAYIKGYEIVNKETKYLELNKARESLTSNNINLKTKGLPTYNVFNVYGSVPLNKEGSDLTAYPFVYLNSVFSDGSVGLNNTESATFYKQTLNRRGEVFDVNDGIKTITINVTSATNPIQSITDGTFESILGTLYYIKSRGSGNIPSSTGTVKALSYSIGPRPLISSSGDYIEVTVVGPKDELELIFKEFDLGDAGFRRKLFTSQVDANTDSNEFGVIVDYSDTITPVIGRVKPNNFFLKKRGSGFNPDTDIILSKGRLGDGTPSYNSVYGLSYFDPEFYTRILLESDPSDGFEAGKYVFGLNSGAYGVIEGSGTGVYSTNNILFVKTLSGRFVSGETIRDELSNTAKIATDNTISHFVVQKRGTGYDSLSSILINGVSYDSSVVNLSKTNTGAIYRASIENRVQFRQEYSQPPTVGVLDPSEGSSDAANIVPVLFRNSVITYGPQNVKSMSSEYGSGNANKFTADVVVEDQQFADIKSVTEFSFFGSQGYKFIESTSFNADATPLLQQGDIVQFSDEQNNLVRSVVQYATEKEGSFKTRVYLDNPLPNDVTNTSIVRLRPRVDNSNSGSLIFPTGSKQIQKISASTEDTKIKYFFRRDFVTTASSSGGNITFAAQLEFGTQRFVSFSEENYVITVLDPGDAPDIAVGDIVYVSPESVTITSSTDTSSGLTSGSISLELPSDYFGTIPLNGSFPKLKLTATLEVTNAKPRLKTAIKNKRILVTSSGDRVVPFRGQDYDSEVIELLSYSDAYKLRYVYEGTTASAPDVDTAGNLITGTDVTDRFTFDNGQRDTVYDVSRIVLKPGFEPTSGQLVIAFDYFEQSQGDFCVIDSYLHEAGVTEDEIPTFNSSVHGIVNLKNVIDFRPKVDTNKIIAGFQDATSLAQTSGSFSGPGAVIASSPASDSNLEYSISFNQVQYLDRIDGIFLSNKGEFIIKEGNSSLNPTKPEVIEDAIPLFYAYIPAFTQSSKDVRITNVDNRRYTMRDIGKLEKRIERLEYYTTLSILEQQALNMQVKDDIGFDRFKSGFFVDNFESHRTGNLKSLDYQCAIDTQQSVLRPQSKENSFALKEVNQREDQRVISGYKRSGDIVTLPFTSLEVIGNDFASKTLNPNPFVVLQYVGDAEIKPSIDQWYDDTTEPIIVDTNTDVYKVFLAKDDAKESFSSIHNSYIVNFVGAKLSFNSINSLGENNTENSVSSVAGASVSSSSNISPQNNEVGKGIQTTSVGGNSVSTAIKFFARSIPVKFVIRRLKPNTKVSVFLEGRNVSRWVNPDLRFTGVAGNSLSAFNGDVVTDENGNASGLVLLPAGLPPRENALWTGDVDTVDYDDSAEEIRVTTGVKTFRFTSSSTDEDKLTVDTYAEVKYYATGILPDNPSGIISTKPSFFKSNEGVQFIESNTDNPIRPNPLAQTFKIENYEGGLFTTGVDLFFNKKSDVIPVKVYLTNVDSDKPGKNIIPGSEKTLLPYTLLKCFTNGNVNITKGEFVTGTSSAASGPIEKVIDKNGVDLVPSSRGIYTLTNEQVYTLVLSNHNGRSFAQNEDLSVDSLNAFNVANGTQLTLSIAKDSGKVSDIRVVSTGQNYTGAVLTIESPQLPGGSIATASVKISDGKIYNARIELNGFGYTEAPSVVIRGIGNGAGGCVVETVLEIDTPAVRMGVATDNENTTQSTVPTHFEFDHPVYLQNNTEYAMAIETDSVDYDLWASRLGEIDISTSTVITTQPSLGSVYRSQNVDNWTEDNFEDIKFRLYRAEFVTNRSAEILLKNENLGYELLNTNPFETNSSSSTNATAKLFRSNNSVVKVNHRDHGFEDSENSYVFFRTADATGGITADVLNNTLFEVKNSGVDTYTITSPTKASGNSFGGGNEVYASFNRKFETLYPQVRYLTFADTKIETMVKTTNVVPVDSNTTNYTSYSQSEYEKTFLNEPHYFGNQKVIASEINEVLNNVDRSLEYKMVLSSDVSYLSPVIDLSTSSVKAISNRVDKSSGKEDRFGRRDQVLTFYPVYQFTLTGNGTDPIQDDQVIKGENSKAIGVIAKVDESTVWVRVKTPSIFQVGETVTLANQTTLTSVTVDSSPSQLFADINDSAVIVARNPSNLSQTYDNIITGRVVIWNNKTQEITLKVDTQPINDDFTGAISDNILYNRNADIGDQIKDIFRAGDIIKYPDQPDDEEAFFEIKSIDYTNGFDFVEENTSKNGSSVAKYVTKEISIANPAVAIDVHLTANSKDISDIEVLYKYKTASSEESLEDLDWIYFNGNGQPDSLVIATPENTISSVVEKQSSYQDLKYSVSNLPEFSNFAIKIVMKSNDPAYVPKIQDIRAVAGF